MRISARGIIIEDGKVLTMFRRKVKNENVREYYVIPGGGQETGETLEETVKRELREEMNVDVNILGFVGKMESEQGTAYFFHCKIESGTIKLGGEELDKLTVENYYEPRFVKLEDLANIDIIGTDYIQKAIKKEYLDLIDTF